MLARLATIERMPMPGRHGAACGILSRRGLSRRRYAATRSAAGAATGLLVHRGPGARLRFLLADTVFLVAFFDVARLTFLLARIRRLVSAWHCLSPLLARPST